MYYEMIIMLSACMRPFCGHVYHVMSKEFSQFMTKLVSELGYWDSF